MPGSRSPKRFRFGPWMTSTFRMVPPLRIGCGHFSPIRRGMNKDNSEARVFRLPSRDAIIQRFMARPSSSMAWHKLPLEKHLERLPPWTPALLFLPILGANILLSYGEPSLTAKLWIALFGLLLPLLLLFILPPQK